MLNEVIKHTKDLSLESSISGSLSSVKSSHFHVISFIINVIISDISSLTDIRLIVDITFTISGSVIFKTSLDGIKLLISWSSISTCIFNDKFLWVVVVFLRHIG